jgi:LacI family transcriptional regulator
MIRLILLTDFTEAFPHRLLRGILRYAREQEHEPWVACRMPPSYKDDYGMVGVLEWAKKWGADAIIGRFNNEENVTLFSQNNIVVLAQDFKKRFSIIPNISSDYYATGEMAAQFFLNKGFTHFAFFGYQNVVWSDERCEGFRRKIAAAGYNEYFYEYRKQRLEDLWFYESTPLVSWLKSLPLHTALFCCDDNQGNKITEICKFSDIQIPADIAVLGVDNDTTICSLSDPNLSSVNLDIEKGGYEAAHLITQLMRQPNGPFRNVVIHPTGVVNRMSTNVYATDDPNILKALNYIHQNISVKLSVGDILRQVPLSRRLLEIRFKQITGQSIYDYISIQRMELFAQLLLESNAPIADIAFRVGINNYGNLSRQFKSVKGCTPTDYRKRNKIDNSL